MKNIDRIFTFGCSWTKHWWPTWVDVIRYSVDIPVYNWGYGGIGNVGIFHRLVECDLKNKFTDKDLILVQWSSWTREDRFLQKWSDRGNIFTVAEYDIQWIKKYWSWDNDVIKNSTAIITANKLFDIKFQTTMIPIGVPESIIENNENNNITKFYFDMLPKTIVNFPNEKNTMYYGNCVDNHPDPLTHLYFYEEILRKSLCYLPECKKTNEIKDFQNRVSMIINKNMSFDKTRSIIMSQTKNFDQHILENQEGF